jgi:hypothetical protein
MEMPSDAEMPSTCKLIVQGADIDALEMGFASLCIDRKLDEHRKAVFLPTGGHGPCIRLGAIHRSVARTAVVNRASDAKHGLSAGGEPVCRRLLIKRMSAPVSMRISPCHNVVRHGSVDAHEPSARQRKAEAAGLLEGSLHPLSDERGSTAKASARSPFADPTQCRFASSRRCSAAPQVTLACLTGPAAARLPPAGRRRRIGLFAGSGLGSRLQRIR